MSICKYISIFNKDYGSLSMDIQTDVEKITRLEYELNCMKNKARENNPDSNGYYHPFYGKDYKPEYAKKCNGDDIALLFSYIDKLESALATSSTKLEAVRKEAKDTEANLRKQLDRKNEALQLQRDELALELQPLLEMSDDTSATAVRDFLKKLIAKIQGDAPLGATLVKETVADLAAPLAKPRKMLY